MPWPISRAAVSVRARVHAAGARRGRRGRRVRADDRDVPRPEADVADRRRDRSPRVRGRGAGLVARRLADLDRARVRGRRARSAIEWLRSRRKASGDLALALFFYSGIALGVVLVSLGGGLNANLLTYLFGQPLTVNDSELVVIVALGGADRRRDAGAPPRAVRGRDRRGLVACRGPAGRVRQQRARGADRGGRRRRDADRRHPAGRRDDGACRSRAASCSARSFGGTLRWSVAVSVGSVVAGLGRVAGSGDWRPAARSCSSPPRSSRSSSVARRSAGPALPARRRSDL